jgi:hypothetical protein
VPRKYKASETLFVNHLLEAVKHVSHAQRSRGDEAMTHCMIRYGRIVAFDRTIAAGAPVIEDDLDCCPQTERLRLALERCGAEHQIVQDAGSLFVRSGEFSAYVPLCDPAKLSTPIPDAACAPLGDAFRASLMITASLVKESAPTVLQSAVQLNPGSTVASNGTAILEAWHGFDMPPGLVIPKLFADAVVKCRKKIVAFGFSDLTLTVHFEGDCWLRTNLYKRDSVPSMLEKFVNVETMHAFPEGFFSQVADIAKWSEDGRVYIDNFLISSHRPDKRNVGSSLSFPMTELMQGVSYSINALRSIAKFATHYQDRATPNVTMFFGNGLRGAMAHESISAPSVKQEESAEEYAARMAVLKNQMCDCGKRLLDCDVCIPF